MPHRIDVHAHFVPDFYREALLAAGHSQPDGIKSIPGWTTHDALAAMDRLEVTKSYLSISTPGVHFGDDAAARDLARQVNEEGARLRQEHPDRFGFFASLPLPDVDAAVTEMRYALDTLHADGVVLETNMNGMYLGDDRLEPVYAEAASRRSVIFIHPTTPYEAEHLALGYPRPMLEFFFDTTRSITHLLLSGVLERQPELKVIVPHAGAALSILANRIDLLLPILSEPGKAPPPSVKKALRSLHFDLAGAPVPELLGALLQVADTEHIHYGSDYPFTPIEACERLAQPLDATNVLDEPLLQSIYTENTERLFS